ncbi:hypothetical protein ACIQMJ_40390 [Actinosynnema sp. NPDC091369]
MDQEPNSQHVENNQGGYVFANQNGRQSIYLNSMVDHLQNGLMALKGKMYAKAATEFEESLSDGRKAGADRIAEASHDLALGHFGAALAMLNGRVPGDRVPEEIDRIENHLEQSIGYGDPVVTHQAKVLWALVKDDYYTAYNMAPRPPTAEVLAESVAALGPDDLEPLLTHLGNIRGRTWQAVLTRASEFGRFPNVEPEVRPTTRMFDPRRAEAVRKYFIPTPAGRSPNPHYIALGGAAALVVLGIAMQSFGTLLFLGGAYFLGKWGFTKLGEYRRYVKRRDEALPKPSDAQMDAWLREDVEHLRAKAGDQVRLNPKLVKDGGDLVYPVQTVVGLPTDDMRKAVAMRVRRGSDGKLRANHYDVLNLFLTNDLISVYRCLVDFRTGEAIYEEVTERHYRDIVGVTSNRIPVPDHIVELFKSIDKLAAEDGQDERQERKYADLSFAQTFSLSIVNGEKFEMSTGFGNATDGTDEVAWPSNGQALDIIKRMVRARHNAR